MSRISGIYLREVMEHATMFKDAHRNRPLHKIVRVMVEDMDKVQRHDVNCPNALPADATLKEAYANDVRYRLEVESESPCREVLYEGEYEILDLV